MTETEEYYEAETQRLHEKLAPIYRLGNLTPSEYIETEGLWARIERLQAAAVAVSVREIKRAALQEAKRLEGIN